LAGTGEAAIRGDMALSVGPQLEKLSSTTRSSSKLAAPVNQEIWNKCN
jgi:hypothetical protein